MQLGLAKLGCTFKSGIDGLYGSKDTIHRVKEFQTAWNTAHPDALLTVDGRAGEQTLKNIVVALGDASWKKENIVSLTAVPAS